MMTTCGTLTHQESVPVNSRSPRTPSKVTKGFLQTVTLPRNSFAYHSNVSPVVVTPRKKDPPNLESVQNFSGGVSHQEYTVLPELSAPTKSKFKKDKKIHSSDDAFDIVPQILEDKIKRNKNSGMRLNKFVRRLHDMLQLEQQSGVVEWRRGLLVLHSTDAFSKKILPKYFNTRNFKTFRRQLNYYGFVHVRSFSTSGSTTTALWVNRDLAKNGTTNISSVLMLKRVEPCESAKTAEGRRIRKELAVSTVEDDIGISAKSLQVEQIRSLQRNRDDSNVNDTITPKIPLVVTCRTVTKAREPDNELAANLLLMLSRSQVTS